MTLAKKSNLPKLDNLPEETKSVNFATKTANKELGQSQRNIVLARWGGFNIEEILCYYHARQSIPLQLKGWLQSQPNHRKVIFERMCTMSILPWNISRTKIIHLGLSIWNAFGHVRKTKRICKYFQEVFFEERQKMSLLNSYLVTGTRPCFQCNNG